MIAGAIYIGLFLYQGTDYLLYPGAILIASVILVLALSQMVSPKKGIEAIAMEAIITGLLYGINHLS